MYATPRPLYPRERPIPLVEEAGWATGPVWTGAENLAPARIRSPDRPTRSESLHRPRILKYRNAADSIIFNMLMLLFYPHSLIIIAYWSLLYLTRNTLYIQHVLRFKRCFALGQNNRLALEGAILLCGERRHCCFLSLNSVDKTVRSSGNYMPLI